MGPGPLHGSRSSRSRVVGGARRRPPPSSRSAPGSPCSPRSTARPSRRATATRRRSESRSTSRRARARSLTRPLGAASLADWRRLAPGAVALPVLRLSADVVLRDGSFVSPDVLGVPAAGLPRLHSIDRAGLERSPAVIAARLAPGGAPALRGLDAPDQCARALAVRSGQWRAGRPDADRGDAGRRHRSRPPQGNRDDLSGTRSPLRSRRAS